MSERAKDRSLYSRARQKKLAGKKLSYEERQRLDLARERRAAKEEATWKKDHVRQLNEKHVGPRFAPTRRGWRVVIPNDHPGGPWSIKDEVEVVTKTGKPVWVTLVRLWFTGGDARRSQWWSFLNGRQSHVVQHIPPPPPQVGVAVPEHKAAESLLDEEDKERITTGAGAAYLAAARKREKEILMSDKTEKRPHMFNEQMKDKLNTFREARKDPEKVAAVERSKRRVVKPQEPTQELKVEHGAVWIMPVLTPAMAQEMLDKQHPGQRPVRENHVEAMERSMSSGSYVWTGDPIRFDSDNQLIDGQHRLTAVVRSGVTLRDVLCVRVTDAEVHKYIDTSIKTRTFSDMRRFLGQKAVSGTVVAAVALEFSDFRRHNRVLLTKVEVNELAETCEFMDELIELAGLSRGRVKLHAVGLGVALRCMRRNHDKSMQFFRAVCSNSYMVDGEFQPIVKLTIDWLLREGQARSVSHGSVRTGLDDLTFANKLLRAYNAWRNGESITKLQQPKTDDLLIPRD